MGKRQQVLINDDIRVEFGFKCEELDLAKYKSKINFLLNKLMQLYIDGKLDEEMDVAIPLKPSQGEKRRLNMDKGLKQKFEQRAYERGLIKLPHYGVRALEYMMRLFLDGELNEKIEEYDKDALEKNS